MFAIAAHPGSTEPTIVDLPEPREPAAHEVLCRTLEVGVCGTDREILNSAAPVIPTDSKYLVLGHECLARVEAVGSSVTGLAVGDLVTPLVRRAFQPSEIRADMLAFGEFVERGIYLEHGFTPPLWLDRPEYLLKVPLEMSDVAILTEPLSVVEKAVNEALILQQARLSPDTWIAEPPRVIVTGLGPIGFAGVLAAVARNWPVWVFGRDSEETFRASLVRQLGGRYVPCRDGDIAITDLEQNGYDLLLECTGSDEVMMSAAKAMRSRAVLCWLGSERIPQARMHNVSRLMRDGLIRNQLIVGCVNSAPRDFSDALSHLAQLRNRCGDSLRQIITERVTPRDSLWHYTHRRSQGIKVVLGYGGQ
jgi:threonine dehydrogenase-like Zn-dependent dehydrogenase